MHEAGVTGPSDPVEEGSCVLSSNPSRMVGKEFVDVQGC